jgi:hypothetical protein
MAGQMEFLPSRLFFSATKLNRSIKSVPAKISTEIITGHFFSSGLIGYVSNI